MPVYGMQEIVKSISCSFAPGSFTGIIGPNGSGKDNAPAGVQPRDTGKRDP